jgi:hypothetical protein
LFFFKTFELHPTRYCEVFSPLAQLSSTSTPAQRSLSSTQLHLHASAAFAQLNSAPPPRQRSVRSAQLSSTQLQRPASDQLSAAPDQKKKEMSPATAQRNFKISSKSATKLNFTI